MPKKGGKKKGGKKKKEEDWGLITKEKYVMLEIRNADWQSMRFAQLVAVSRPLDSVRQMIMEEHQVPSAAGLRLFLGAETSEENLLKTEDYSLSLAELSINGGAKNDHVEQVITYDYGPFKSILNLPRGTRPAPLRQPA